MTDTIKNGGPAFPVSTRPMETELGFGHQDGHSTWQYGGMTLRDYFAAKAMQVVLQQMNREEPFIWLHEDSDSGWSHCSLAARYAYAMADAMLHAREAT